MRIQSLTFGEIEIADDTIYTFDEGIPGLRNISKYTIIESDDTAPFNWLQACESPFLSLMMLDPIMIDPTYKVPLNPEYSRVLGEFTPDDIATRVLIVVPEDPQNMTANLLAPILFNTRTRRGAQVVVEGTRELLRVKVIKN